MMLTDYSDIQTQRLSFGIKRRLSIAIALIGGDQTKLIILDEPTSGLDHASSI